MCSQREATAKEDTQHHLHFPEFREFTVGGYAIAMLMKDNSAQMRRRKDRRHSHAIVCEANIRERRNVRSRDTP
jgi:hypothetical protein